MKVIEENFFYVKGTPKSDYLFLNTSLPEFCSLKVAELLGINHTPYRIKPIDLHNCRILKLDYNFDKSFCCISARDLLENTNIDFFESEVF